MLNYKLMSLNYEELLNTRCHNSKKIVLHYFDKKRRNKSISHEE